MQKLSIIRFKPKPECFDEFVANIKARNNNEYATFHLMHAGDELYAILIRDASTLEADAADGVEWLDGQRDLLQEYDAVNRHTIPLTGDLL